MAVVENVYYTEDKSVLENSLLKMIGFKYEGAPTLDIDKKGFYLVIKAEEEKLQDEKIKEALKNTEEIKDEEKEKILNKFQELEDNAAGGLALFD